jgi:hypothetical protein
MGHLVGGHCEAVLAALLEGVPQADPGCRMVAVVLERLQEACQGGRKALLAPARELCAAGLVRIGLRSRSVEVHARPMQGGCMRLAEGGCAMRARACSFRLGEGRGGAWWVMRGLPGFVRTLEGSMDLCWVGSAQQRP